MALASTTLSAAITASSGEIVVASATSVAVGRLVLVDDEFMEVAKSYVSASTTVPVLRGRQGTKAGAHVSSAVVTHGLASDFDTPGAQGVTLNQYQRVTRIVSYSATGAIALPKQGEDVIAILDGTDALAMTIADPGRDIEGSSLTILAAGAAAHTLTFASGLGGASTSYDVLTLNGTGLAGTKVYAVGGYWISPVMTAMAGTLTNITATIG
jgi:hypothetical protein